MSGPSIQATLRSTPDGVLSAILSDQLFLRQVLAFLDTKDATALVLSIGPAALLLAGILRPTTNRLVAEINPGQFAGSNDAQIKRVVIVTDVLHDGDDPMHSWKTYLRSTTLPSSLNVPTEVRCVVDARTAAWQTPNTQAIESRGIRSVSSLLTETE